MNAIRTLITLRRLNYIVRSCFAEPTVKFSRSITLFKGKEVKKKISGLSLDLNFEK